MTTHARPWPMPENIGATRAAAGMVVPFMAAVQAAIAVEEAMVAEAASVRTLPPAPHDLKIGTGRPA